MENIKQKIFVKYPFFKGAVENVRYVAADLVSTIGTDGKDIFYNQNYVKTLSEEEQIFVFAHEICHIAFNHVSKRVDRIPDIWDFATDAVINGYLRKDGLKLVENAVTAPQAVNYDTNEFYRMLTREDVSVEFVSGHDTHHLWPDETQGGRTVFRAEEAGELDDILTARPDMTELEMMGENEAFDKNSSVRDARMDEMMGILAEQSLEVGDTTNADVRNVNGIGNIKPLMDWRMILKDAVTVEVDWSYRNAEIEDGVLKPYLVNIPHPETEIVLDTSGSINEPLLRNFLRECKNLLVASRVKVGCFDTEFYGFTEIRTEEEIDNMKFVGGGGTDFNTAVNAFSRRVENKIVFTDGEAEMPDKPMDALWVVFGCKKIRPKGGRVIEISEEQLCRWEESAFHLKQHY